MMDFAFCACISYFHIYLFGFLSSTDLQISIKHKGYMAVLYWLYILITVNPPIIHINIYSLREYNYLQPNFDMFKFTLPCTAFHVLGNLFFLLPFSHSVVSESVIPWTAVCQASLSFTISWSLLKLMCIESMMASNHLIYCTLFSSCPQSFPAAGSFPTSRLSASGSQSTGASASVLPMNIQDWFPLGLIGLISLVSKGLLRVFSSTTIQKHQSSSFSLLHGSTLTSVHDYWKNHSFDYTELCQ